MHTTQNYYKFRVQRLTVVGGSGCHWTQANTVPAPPSIEIQRSHVNVKFHENAQGLQPFEGPKLTCSCLTTLTTGWWQ